MDFTVFDTPRPEVAPLEAEQMVAAVYGIEGIASPLAGERDRSFRIDSGEARFVLKIGNRGDRPDALEGQAGAMAHALAFDPGLPLPRVVPTFDYSLVGLHNGWLFQLTEHLAGSVPIEVDTPPGLRRSLGSLAARLSVALRGYDHPALHRLFPWDLTRLPDLAPLLAHVDPERRPVLERCLADFENRTLPALGRLAGQPVHGDLTQDNVVVDPDDAERVVGLFDFGDMSWGPRVIELAIAATYQCFGTDPSEAMAQVTSAFHVVDPLHPTEIALIPGLVMGRCVQSLLMAARHLATHPENAEYATGDAEHMEDTLKRLLALDREEVVARLLRACGHRSLSTGDPLGLRRVRMGPVLALSYQTPVHPERGEGVWLIESDGRRLLDAYNNVPQVGHAHPQVAAAVAAQTRRLSTNTRYLVDEVVAYADRLASLFPDPLSVVMFTNSGSEANDVAYQIAREVTGARGLVTTAHAYHGTTHATAAMSPEEYETPPWSVTVGGETTLGRADAADRLRSELAEATSELRGQGEAPAMVIFDTVFSSEGIFDLPIGYLTTARKWSVETGALLVADEVQAGFGRVGTRFWGFAADNVVPDIVTLGKPMGNGYPIGAVVTTAEIATTFAERSHYFSTFAGSPVAAAAGMAVLDVLEGERLPEQAERVGDYLRREIAGLGHPRVVHLRGPGLFVGAELTDPELTARVVEAMREQGVLIGSTGPRETVLKIRPPLVFTERHADLLVDRLARVLSEIASPGGRRHERA
jgi:4-aminobutyrate aminotransferase-like enzyme/aminoglycoside phosphotransferase (APT) family kinase protein